MATSVRAFIHHWAAALIVAAVFVVAGVGLLGVKVVADHRHDAAEDRASKGRGVCTVYETAINTPSLASSPYTAIARDLCLKYRAGQ